METVAQIKNLPEILQTEARGATQRTGLERVRVRLEQEEAEYVASHIHIEMAE